MRFTWDWAKAVTNLDKHQVSFEEASTVFNDPYCRFWSDDIHSFAEERAYCIGESAQGRLLLVCFTERGADTIHLISARVATPRERKRYEQSDDVI